jgi:sugar/nucleoside kinase (ribokinase family)
MKIDADSFFMQGGGPVPNVCVGLSRMGFKTALIAAVGNDPFGEILLSELNRDNVKTDWVIIKKKLSLLAAGWIEKMSGRRTLVLARELFIKPADIKLSNLPNPKIIHLDGRDMPISLKLARWAKKKNITVSFDIGSVRNDVSEIFPYVDHLVVADEYAFSFTKTKTSRTAIKKLSKLCKGVIVVTEGIKGSTGFNPMENKFNTQKAFKVKNVDTTGAGDCYHTGYLYGLLKGYSLEKRMLFASAAAALKCTKAGARSGIPNEKQLLRFVNSKPRTY